MSPAATADGTATRNGTRGDFEALVLTLCSRDGLPEEAQNEAARLLDLLADIEHHPDRERLQAVRAGLRALCATPPNLRLAAAGRRFIENRIRAYRRPLRAMSREAPATWLLVGAGRPDARGGVGNRHRRHGVRRRPERRDAGSVRRRRDPRVRARRAPA